MCPPWSNSGELFSRESSRWATTESYEIVSSARATFRTSMIQLQLASVASTLFVIFSRDLRLNGTKQVWSFGRESKLLSFNRWWISVDIGAVITVYILMEMLSIEFFFVLGFLHTHFINLFLRLMFHSRMYGRSHTIKLVCMMNGIW